MFQTHPILAVRGQTEEERIDAIAIEAPLEIRLEYPDETGVPSVRPLSITMRTPGADADLALGFLWTEGVLRQFDDVVSREAAQGGVVVDEAGATATVLLRAAPALAWSKIERSTITTGACGMCGKTSLDAVRTGPYAPILNGTPRVAIDVISALPELVRGHQAAFAATGGEHACALAMADGTILAVREDVGRHNALDKIVGHSFRTQALPLHHLVVVLSGRASFELVQKCAMVGVSFVVAVGAPSSAAVDLAVELGMTLIGFARGPNFNVYSGRHRIIGTRGRPSLSEP